MNGPYNHPDRYEIRNATMVDLVRIAYSVDSDKVLGGPSWLELDRFDVLAKAPSGTPPETLKLMLQSLLQERFHLVSHPGSKPFPAYTVSLGKTPKLKESEGSGGNTGCMFRANVMPAPGGGPGPAGPITLTVSCHEVTVASFLSNLRGFVGVAARGGSPPPIIDKTELKGTYDVEFKVPLDDNFGAGDSTFIDALDKQVGLKLETSPIPMPVVLVDSVNRTPGENPPGSEKSFPPLPAEFEVVSLKPGTPPPAPTPGRAPARTPAYQNDRVNLRNQTLRQLINLAWNLSPNDTIVAAPKWLDSDRYDVVAKVPEAAAPAGRGAVDLDAYRPMFQALLQDRFQLKVHYEDKVADCYVLTAAKPKLQKADPVNRTRWSEGPGPDGKDPRKSNPSVNRLVYFQNMSISQFAALLPTVAGGYIRTPVQDNTGLEGAWDFTLSFSGAGIVNGNMMRVGDSGTNTPGGPSAPEPSGGLSLFDAIAKQLGLKLETQKRPVPTLVIDHIEQKPAEN